jgi:hypothetical protein
MQWVHYWRNIVERYLVICEGWPDEIPFDNLSKASSGFTHLEMLLRKWKSGDIYWRQLETQEFQQLLGERGKKLGSGEIVERSRRTRSDKGKKRRAHSPDENVSSRPRKKTYKSLATIESEDEQEVDTTPHNTTPRTTTPPPRTSTPPRRVTTPPPRVTTPPPRAMTPPPRATTPPPRATTQAPPRATTPPPRATTPPTMTPRAMTPHTMTPRTAASPGSMADTSGSAQFNPSTSTEPFPSSSSADLDFFSQFMSPFDFDATLANLDNLYGPAPVSSNFDF